MAGLITSRHSVEGESVQRPLMKLVSLVTGGAATVVMMEMPFAVAKNVVRSHELRAS
ncbi:MAG: hypothetical protein WB729_06220 [Candidatus Sulfotelmatobacter sp.]